MNRHKIVVIGGGAAGLFAAGCAAEAGAEVLVCEKMNRPGRKLAITGKGRCNVTNVAEINEFLAHFGTTGRFLRNAFSRFFNTDLITFFETIGLPLVTERGGRVFPAGGKATDVVSVLLRWVNQLGVQIKSSSAVESLLIENGRVTGVVVQGKHLVCDAVILACGGASYPATGSSGDGYRLAEAAGHTIVPVRPALVPLETKGNITASMAELNLRNINVGLYIDGKKRREAFGELVFSEFGVTGPVILTLSGEAVDALRGKHMVSLHIDLKPALDEKKLDARLLRDFGNRGKEPIESVLRGLLPKQMVPPCLTQTGIAADKTACTVSAKERKKLRNWLKNLHLDVTGYRPFSEAIVTAGGVNTKEVNPRTMESNCTQGLYIIGELLDVHGDTGGYNLQAAFSTGWIAGRSAAAEQKQ